MESDKKCGDPTCTRLVESDRPKQSRYCKRCAAIRSKRWKRQHPERVKLYDTETAGKRWRHIHDWNAYIALWRRRHHTQYREQNNRHVREYRQRENHTQHDRPPPVLLPLITVVLSGIGRLIISFILRLLGLK
jgi:hypothetical protein